MLGLIPALTFVLLALACPAWIWRSALAPLRESALASVTILGAWMVLGAEVLSLPRWLAFWPLLVWWMLPTLLLAALCTRSRTWAPWTAWWRRDDRPRLGSAHGIGIACVALLVVSLAVAAASPVNVWDCLAYHMPRQVYWLSQASVAHFPVHDPRQLMLPPFAEFVGVHLMALAGDGRWAIMPHWLALPLMMAAGTLIAQTLGAGLRGQAVGAFVAASSPLTFLFATNAKNDLIAGLWLCILALLATRVLTDRTLRIGRALWIGAVLGLLVLTKSTGPMLALPLCAAIGIGALVRCRARCLSPGLLILALALAINAPHLARNHAAFGNVNGLTRFKDGGYEMMATAYTPAAIASGLVRSAALHAGTPSRSVNSHVYDGIVTLHRWMGIDPNDRRTTYTPRPPFDFHAVQYLPFHESAAPSPIHMLLLVVIPLAVLLRPRLMRWQGRTLLWAPVLAFALVSMFVKWNPFTARYHVPVFCLMAPMAGVVLGRTRVGSWATVAACAAVLMPTMLYNGGRPILGPRSVFLNDIATNTFHDQPHLRDPHREIVRLAVERRPRVVGLWTRGNDFEYATQRAIIDSLGHRPRFTAFNARFPARLAGTDEPPDVVIAVEQTAAHVVHAGSRRVYRLVARAAPLSLYESASDLDPRTVEDQLPPFHGVEKSSGLGADQGPVAGWDNAIGRWGTGPATTIEFRTGGGPMALWIDALCNIAPDQEIAVSLNGQRIESLSFARGIRWNSFRVPLDTIRGSNTLTLEYRRSDNPRRLAVFYRKLQVLPAEPP